MNVEYRLSEIKNVSQQLWNEAKAHKIWAFHGEMGAGKTTFIHALCEVLGVTDTISSPTFAIINEYKSDIAGTIFHSDWYRIKNEEEALQAGVEDCLLSGNLCLIEWPEKAPGILPADAFNIFIETVNEKTRRLYTQTEDAN